VVSCFGISEDPHGGVKAKRSCRTHGRFGLDEMVRIKMWIPTVSQHFKKVWWYGYGEKFSRQKMEGFSICNLLRALTERVRGGLRSTRAFQKKTLNFKPRIPLPAATGILVEAYRSLSARSGQTSSDSSRVK